MLAQDTGVRGIRVRTRTFFQTPVLWPSQLPSREPLSFPGETVRAPWAPWSQRGRQRGQAYVWLKA